MSECSIAECGRPAMARGWCGMHYYRVARHGDVNHRRPTQQEYLFRQIDTSGDCWLWTGYIRPDTGYGFFNSHAAHRAVYEELVGKIPAGMTLDHLCRVRHCVNPDHLEVVSSAVNSLRGFGPFAVNARKTHCKRGHPLSGDNLVVKRGSRICVTCDAAWWAEHRLRRQVAV